MGILSKFKELLDKKPIETLKEIELELYRIKKKSFSHLVALIGIDGELKGLPLIFTRDYNNTLEKISEKLSDIYLNMSDFSNGKEFDKKEKMHDFIIHYEDKVLLFRPIMENVGFFAFIKDESGLINIRQWMDKMIPKIQNFLQIGLAKETI